MKESDWKKFRSMVVTLRERYITRCNDRLTVMLNNPDKTETERFWETYEEMKIEAKNLVRCLDGHSRSKMTLFLERMIRVGMLKREDITVFSEELQAILGRDFDDCEKANI